MIESCPYEGFFPHCEQLITLETQWICFFKVDATANDATLAEIRANSEAGSLATWWNPCQLSLPSSQAGLIASVIEAWYPSGDHEYAFFFEDDIEASPFYFAWAKYAILLYREGSESTTKHVLRQLVSAKN